MEMTPEIQNAIIGAIAILTPVVVDIVRRTLKAVAPGVPVAVLPYLAPILGPTLNVLMEQFFGVSIDIVPALAAGGAGVAIREATNKTVNVLDSAQVTKKVGDT